MSLTSNAHELNLPIAAIDLFKYHMQMSPETQKHARVMETKWYDEEFQGVTYKNWGIFSAGLTLGILFGLATSIFASMLNPCFVQWITVISIGYSFWVYMLVFESNGMESLEEAFMLALTMAQFVMAMRMGSCDSDSHGFRDPGSGFWANPEVTMYDLFTIDVHDFVDKYDGSSQYRDSQDWNLPDAHVLVEYAKSMLLGQSAEEDDAMTALIANLLLLGGYTALQVYADYLTFLNRWENDDFFNAGAFLGRAIVNGVVVLYIVLLAVNLRELLQGAA